MVNSNNVVIYHNKAVIYCGILTLENHFTAVIYHAIFILMAPLTNVIKLFSLIHEFSQ
jgi:hypothetical protein